MVDAIAAVLLKMVFSGNCFQHTGTGDLHNSTIAACYITDEWLRVILGTTDPSLCVSTFCSHNDTSLWRYVTFRQQIYLQKSWPDT
jgi:hypothetical protein